MFQLRLSASVVAMALAHGVMAQTAQPVLPGQPAATANAPVDAVAATTPDNAPAGVEDIIVTATRRSVNLQNVPASIEAVSAGTLKTFNVTGVNQLVTLTSGLVSVPSGGNNLFLRGIGSPSTGYNEAQVAVYVDGLYLANPAVGILSFNNIDRVEVLKGPQGTLYGRNVTGGLISVITRDPSPDERHLDASVGYANYDTVQTNVYATTPITDTLAANVAVYHAKQSEGWSRNVILGNDVQRSDETGIEAKLKWHPEPRTTVTGTFIYDFNNRDIGSAYQVEPGTLGSDGTPFLGRYRVASEFIPSGPTNIYIGSLKVEHDFGFATLASITGYQTSHALISFTGGSPVLTASNNIFYEKNKTFSQELQLTSKKGSRFDWVAGAFYYHDDTELRLDTVPFCPGGVCLAPVPTRSDGFPTTRSISIYGDGTYRFFDSTKVTVGLRYTNEDKGLSGLVTPIPGFSNSVTTLPPTTALYPGATFVAGGVVQPGIPTQLNFERLTYRFVVQQDLTDDIHLYASHNLGFKSGAFNGNLFSNPPVAPELLYATEGGFKSEFFDRRLRLDASYFHYTYKNVQLRSIAPPAPPGNALLQNAASERLDGIDADFSVVPFRGLTVNGTLEHLIARYDSYPGATRVTQGPNRLVNGVLVGTVINTTPFNLAGFTPSNAPAFSASFGFVYAYDTRVGTFSFAANDHYNSSTPRANDDSVIDPPHHIVDLSLNWTSLTKRYDASLWVKNLGDEYVYAVGQISNNFVIAPGAPRTFGGTVGVHF